MKRLLLMHQSSSIGGGSYCLLNIVKALDRSLWEPIVALKEDGPLTGEIKKMGVEVVFFKEMTAIPYNQTLWKYANLRAYQNIKKSLSRFKEFLKETRADVVYVNNMMLCYYLCPAKECGCKTIVHIREHWPLDEHRIQLSWIRSCIYNYADRVIAINNYSASMFPLKPSTIVHDWIDFKDRYENMPYDDIFKEDMHDKKVFLYTGGQQKIKGALEVVKAFVKAQKDASMRLLIVGDISYPPLIGWRGKLKKFLIKLGIKPYYYELNELVIHNNDIIKVIPTTYKLEHIIAQCYCFISYFTIPHANLAMAECIIKDKVCIAALNEESLEYSNNGQLAFLVSPHNLNALQKCIEAIGDNYARKLLEIKQSSEIVKKMFSKDFNIDKLNKVINELC